MRSRLLAGSLLAATLLVAHAVAQSPAAEPPPARTETAAADLEDLAIEDIRTVVSFDADGTRTSTVAARMRVNTAAGVQQAGTVMIPYRREATTLRVDHVRVHKPGGVVVETPLTATFDLPAPITQQAPTYSDLYLRHINVQALQPGDVLDYEWHATEPSLLPGHFWYSATFDDDVAGEQMLEVSWPESVRPIVKSLGPVPAISTADGRTTYRWEAPAATVDARPNDEGGNDDTRALPDVQVTSFRDWAEVGDLIRALWQGRADVTPAIQERAEALTRDLSSADEKARALYRFVASDIRYVAVAVGVGRIQPNPAETVLTNGFGDCKDKHVVLEALLRAVGITATPVLIGPGAEVDADIPSLASFSHVITRIDGSGSEPVWVDTTLEVAPFGHLIATERDARVLPIPAAGRTALTTTPAQPLRANVWHTTTDGLITTEGQLQTTVREEVAGDLEVLLRMAFRSAGRQNWPQLIRAFPLPRTRPGTVADITISTPEDTDTPFRIEYRLTVDKFADWQSGTLRPPAVVDVSHLPDADTRATKVELGPRVEFVVVSKLALPTDVEVQQDSSPAVNLDHPFAGYTFTWSVSGRTLVVERRLVSRVETIPADQVDAYRAFATATREAPYTVGVRRVTPWAWNDNATIDWYGGTSAATRKALTSAADIGRRGDYQEALASIREVLNREPDNDSAWQLLAWAQYASGARERALETLRRRAPSVTSPSLLRYYASRLTDMGRRDEAIDVWRLGHEHFPDDREFPLYLGDALVAAGRHAEAVDVLQSQLAGQTSSARYHMTLSRALLGDGNRTAATTSLLRSAELDNSPRHSNNVAWALGDERLALDEALELARRAVAETTAVVNATTPGATGLNELRAVASLAEYWNTLGWIHFRRGDLDEATRYLEAAFHLSQRSIHATHLAEFHESTGNNAAVTIYRRYVQALDSSASMRAFLASDGGASAGALTDVRNALDAARTVRVPGTHTPSSSIEVLLTIGTDARIRDITWLGAGGGRDGLGDALRAAPVPWPAPDADIVHMVRRGRISCTSAGDCTLLLHTVTDATAPLP